MVPPDDPSSPPPRFPHDPAVASSRVLHHVRWRSALPDPQSYEPSLTEADYFADLREPELIRRAAYYRALGRHLDMLGLQSPLEPDLPAAQPFHPLDSARVATKLGELGFDADVAAELVRAGVSVASRRMVRGARWHDDGEDSFADQVLANFPADMGAVDPLYGVALWRHGRHTANRTFAIGTLARRIEAVAPERRGQALRGPLQDLMLGEGVSTGRELFAGCLHAGARRAYERHQVAEYTVQDLRQFHRLIDRLSAAVASNGDFHNAHLWFRGQTADYLIPDRAALARAGVLPYSLAPESSIVPSLYRVIDAQTDSPESFHRLVHHLGDWALSADLLVTSTTVPPVPPPPPGTTTRVSYFSGGAAAAASVAPGPGILAVHEHLDAEGNVVQRVERDLDPGRRLAERGLALQHYGCKTSWVDITKDPAVALWFALHDLVAPPGAPRGALTARARLPWSDTDPSRWPTIFVFVLTPSRHPVLDTEALLAPSGALRPERQRCGLLGGAANLLRNFGARLIALKIRLAPSFDGGQMPPASYYFPDPSEDAVLGTLQRVQAESDEPPLFPAYFLAEWAGTTSHL
jgi:hypothetical protein